MKTSRWVGVVVCTMIVVGQASTAWAQQSQDAGQNPECMRQFLEQSAPYVQQMVWYADQASNYPLSPQARPLVTGWPYSAYGPGNGYGPGSPYGPAFGPWGVGSFGPGFGGPFGYGIGPNGVGGPAWWGANSVAGAGVVGLANTPPGLGYSAVVNQLAATPGGIAALSPGDLSTAAQLPQLLLGNVLSAGSLAQAIWGNRTADAALRQAVVGNRLAAANLNATLALYPSTVANNLGQTIQGLRGYYEVACAQNSDQGASGGAGRNSNGGDTSP